MEYLIHPLLDEGRIREPKSRSVLRACKFARQPEQSGAQFAQGQALPFFGETCPLKSRDQGKLVVMVAPGIAQMPS